MKDVLIMNHRVVIFADVVGSQSLHKAIESTPNLNLVAVVATHDLNNVRRRLPSDIPLLHHASNMPSDIAKLKRDLLLLSPDLGICFSYDRKIPREVFEVPLHGTLNFHGGKLPEYRGANVLNWALINGETRTYMTLHVMSEQIDAGPVIADIEVPISLTDTALDLREKLVKVVPELLAKNLLGYLNGNVKGQSQGTKAISSYRRRLPEDGLVDLSWPPERIYNANRALVDPWPGIFWFDRSGQKHVSNTFLSLEEIKRIVEQFGQKT
jgi:methionyl-tRNA formyltransferase